MDIRKGKYAYPFHPLTRIALLGVLIVSCIFSLYYFKASAYFPIQIVRVYGVNHVENQEVKDLLLPLINHGFFAVDVGHVRERLAQIPWVADIFVRRHWPDAVEVTIIEKHAIAEWNEQVSGAKRLLSDKGILFSPQPNTYPQDLPHLVGPDGKQVVMLQYFMEMNRLLLPLHAKILELELTPYRTWKLTLDNGMVMQMGHQDILTRLDRFVRVYPKVIGQRVAEVDYVDLRYPNGMAVQWKGGTPSRRRPSVATSGPTVKFILPS